MLTAMHLSNNIYSIEPDNQYHYTRPRMNSLLMEAVQYPLTVVCAGAGYGKTRAIYDFAEEFKGEVIWIQLSERDNIGARFWENFLHTLAQCNAPYAKACAEIGFPDTDDKINQFFYTTKEYLEAKPRILVFDDVHLLTDKDVTHFLERVAKELLQKTSMFLLSRCMPRINTAELVSKGKIFTICEGDLGFTEQELVQYFRDQGILLQQESVHSIIQDTEGWSFALNIIVRSYKNAPGYEGYLRNAMKSNIFHLIESQIWNRISGRLQSFMIRLSMIDHLAVDLIWLLAKGDEALIAELEQQNAFVRIDHFISAYLIHHLLLEFLRDKQMLLSPEEAQETYKIAADWCVQNGFLIDAMGYYEKVGDYASIVSILSGLPLQVPMDIARFAEGIFMRAKPEMFDQVEYLAVEHVRVVLCTGQFARATALMQQYEDAYLSLPENDDFRNRLLGSIYYGWGILRLLMCTMDDRYDFCDYFAKMDACLSRTTVDIKLSHPHGAWVTRVGISRAGALQEFIDALTKATGYASHCFDGVMAGMDDLARGELKFYQGDFSGAESDVLLGLERAGEHKQFETMHQALFYILRIAMAQGNRAKAEQALGDMRVLLGENAYPQRYITYDIAEAWYYAFLDLPEMVAPWIKDKFTSYWHPSFIENYGNQAKARYCFRTRNYPLLLAYIEGVKQRESILYGRLEVLAMEACVHYKMKNKAQAFAALAEGYRQANPDKIIMPFVSLGKDMRTLTASAAKCPDVGIPIEWLEDINRRSATYAKRQAHIMADYRQANRLTENISFSERESEVLSDLSHGLSRKEIAISRGLSVNTVKMVINTIYTKLGAENLADLIRIAAGQKMI